MNNIGKTIADYRKQANMTQSEVADALGVTFQAVSKWERNESLPDITLLPKLSELFHVSIDQLLCGSFKIEDEASLKAAKAVCQDEEVADDTFNFSGITSLLESLAPLIKPKKLDQIFEKAGSKLKNSTNSLYPFMSEDNFTDMIEEMDLEDESDLSKVVSMMPFLSEKNIDELLERFEYNHVNPAIYPFLNEKQLQHVLDLLLENEAFDKLVALYPFLEEVDVEKACEYMIHEDCLTVISSAYPFISDRYARLLMQYYLENEMFSDASGLAVFL